MNTNFRIVFKNRADITCSSVVELGEIIRKYGSFPYFSSMTVYWGNLKVFNTMGIRVLNCQDLVLRHELREAIA